MIHPDKQHTLMYFLVIIFALTLTSWVINNRSSFQNHLCPLAILNEFPEAATHFRPAERMSAKEMFRYLHWTNSSSCLFAVDFGFNVVIGNPIAAPDGHKAVCLDQFISPEFDNCLVYSFGINNQWSFDEAMAQYGCQVYAFDPSMSADDYDRSRYIHFYRLGLAGNNDLNPSSSGWNISTASSIYKMLRHRHGDKVIDVFKMDVEFAEWEVIPQMLRSGFLADKVKQLAVEIHFKEDDPLEAFRSRIRVLQELESTPPFSDNETGKFVRFSSRPNLWLKRPISILGGEEEYIGLELAWYNSRFYDHPAKDTP